MKAVLNLFLREDFAHIKSTKSTKKASKALNGIKILGQKHKNANKRISDYFPIR